MESYPKFHNKVGVPIVRIGCREFKCIGDKPPQDHPHIYLKMGDASEIVCPYCSTLFRFDVPRPTGSERSENSRGDQVCSRSGSRASTKADWEPEELC
jgi:uncharacterized Zn-finger protein